MYLKNKNKCNKEKKIDRIKKLFEKFAIVGKMKKKK